MHEALDIYIKLLIAIISFIAPLIIHLLSVFSDGTAVMLRRFKEYEDQTTNLIKDRINAEDANVPKLIKEDSEKFEKRRADNTKQLYLLDPKKQIVKIFPTFFWSLMFVLLNRLLTDNDVKFALNMLSEFIHPLILVICILISFCFAISGVQNLKNVVWAIIDVKQEIAQENAKENQQLKAIKITSPDKENK